MEVHHENEQEAKKVEEVERARQATEEVQQTQQVGEQTGAEIKEVEEEKTDAETSMVKRAFGLLFIDNI